jgi:hypothetical protein
MATINDETKAAKKALVAAGYQCSVKKGVGSCRGWIHVAIRDRRETREEYDRVRAIVKKASGRENLHDDSTTDYFCEDISIEFSYRENIPATCQCGATGTDLDRRSGADDLERIYCRKCGKQVLA